MVTSMKKDEPIFYGGQALIEGVMMRGKTAYSLAIRRPDGEIEKIDKPISSAANRWPILKWPIIRGVVAFGSSMAVGFRALSQSAEIAMQDDAPPTSRFEKFLTEKLGDKLNKVLMSISMVVAVMFALGLFMLLPAWIGSLIGPPGPWVGVVEGLVRILIFVLYIYIISRARDIQRVFQYHGAEHKAINCYEQKLPLTYENVMACSRLHKRCGTSFLLVVFVISMLLFMVLRIEGIWMRFGSRIVLLPLIAGLAYEVSVKWAGKRDNFLVRAIIVPGMALQRMTTSEPDEQQIDVAVAALTQVLAQEQLNADVEITEAGSQLNEVPLP